jgi:hypothetical protein
MKKIIAISLVAASLAASSSFGQGYFAFATGKSQVYDGFTLPSSSQVASTVDVTFLWAPVGSTVSMPLTSTPITGNSNTVESYTVATAWADILSSGFAPAVNSASSTAAVQLSSGNGSVTYNGGANFGVTGTTSPTGSTQYALFLVGWGGGYSSLAAAAAANAPVGWSSVFTYTAGQNASSSTATFNGSSPNFGVFVPAVVPEPCTLALAALGGAAMLLIRRKK